MLKRILFTICLISAMVCTAQLDEINEKLKSKPPTEETALWLCDTAFSFYANDPELAEEIAILALEKSKQWNIDLGMAKANHVLSISFWSRDLHEEAIKFSLEALSYYEKLDDKRGMALINMNIGNVYDDLGQHRRSVDYLSSSLATFRQIDDSVNLGRCLNNLAVVFKNLKKIDSSSYYYKESLGIRYAMGDSIGVARIHNNVAVLYLDNNSDLTLDDARFAYKNLTSALSYLRETTDLNLLATVYANLGKSLAIMGRYNEARSYIDKSLELATQIRSLAGRELANNRLSDLYERQGNYKKAFEYYMKEIALANEIRNENVAQQIEELNIKYETAKKEKQLAEMERQKAIDRSVRNMLIISTAAVILISVVLLVYVFQKRKKDRLISTLKVQKLNDELNHKNKEIASYTMSFLQKNQLMDELKDQINELKKNSDLDTNKELTRINRIVDNTFRSDEEWKTFQITFDQMHDGFFKELKKAYPDISNAELKLCALLRLNMNLKESSKVLGIAPESVKTARYRLRKKLDLNTEDNLVNFLIQFEKERVG